MRIELGYVLMMEWSDFVFRKKQRLHLEWSLKEHDPTIMIATNRGPCLKPTII